MAENSEISWTRHTFNGWLGCTHVSPGCINCYAENMMDHRYHRANWGAKGKRVLTADSNWAKPHAWNAAAAALGEIHSVFCMSLADGMDDHPSILPSWRHRLWGTIADCQNLEWLLLTKRPENWWKFLPVETRRAPFEHIRLGVSIEDQKRADERGPFLVEAKRRGFATFVSYGPACGLVNWDPLMRAGAMDWLVAEGESGVNARPAHPDWFRQARDQAAYFGVPFHFKQWGEFASVSEVAGPGRIHKFPDGACVRRVGVKAAGRLLDGVLHDAFPEAA